MPKQTQKDKPVEYIWPHPRYKVSTNKKWLEGRLKYPTGFCTPYNPLEAQGHEGDRPVSRTGIPLKTCDFWETCPCTCHEQIDQIYELSGLSREPAEQNPDYEAMVATQHAITQAMLDNLVVSRAISAPLSMSGDLVDHPSDERPARGPVDSATGTPAPPAVPHFTPTPTGRRARGQLEYDVLTVCIDFANNVFDWEYCTPKNVSEEIGKRYAIEPPSTGAINAVWDRWEKLEFATQDKKPSRFVKFNVNPPSSWALDQIKMKNKREKKRGQAEQRRGTLRPRQR